MANKTLTLPKKGDPLADIEADGASAPAPSIDDAAIAAYLRSKGFTVEQKLPSERVDIVADRTEHLPTAAPNPFDLSKIPPPGERAAAPIQAQPKTWGNPRLLMSPRPAPQPLFVPPKGR